MNTNELKNYTDDGEPSDGDFYRFDVTMKYKQTVFVIAKSASEAKRIMKVSSFKNNEPNENPYYDEAVNDQLYYDSVSNSASPTGIRFIGKEENSPTYEECLQTNVHSVLLKARKEVN